MGIGDLFVEQDLAGAQDLAFLAFGEDDALGLPLCALWIMPRITS